MRENIFKAKRKDNGEWVEGCLIIDYVSGQYFIHQNGNSVNESPKIGEEGCLRFLAFEIDPETICQYTGLTDKNGKKIWENDIVKCNKRKEGYDLYKVVWRKDFADFGVEPIKPKFESRYPIGLSECDTIYGYDYKVIGNIFDNPELLGG